MDTVSKYWSKVLQPAAGFVCLGHHHYGLMSVYVPRAIIRLSQPFFCRIIVTAYVPQSFWTSRLLFAAGQLLMWQCLAGAHVGDIGAVEVGFSRRSSEFESRWRLAGPTVDNKPLTLPVLPVIGLFQGDAQTSSDVPAASLAFDVFLSHCCGWGNHLKWGN